jgi:hypothetical protein
MTRRVRKLALKGGILSSMRREIVYYLFIVLIFVVGVAIGWGLNERAEKPIGTWLVRQKSPPP